MKNTTDIMNNRLDPEEENGPGGAVCAAEADVLEASRRLLQKNGEAYRVLAEERPKE